MDWSDIKRWMKICLRTLHLLSVAGVGGGVIFGIEESLWLSYWWLALASGGLMILMDMIANPVWLVQVRGLVIMVKLVLVFLLGHDPSWDKALLAAVIVMSAVISHAPGKLRYYSLLHRKVITSDMNSKG